MLQLPVLVLQLLQLLGFTAVHPTILRLPAVVSLLRDPVLSARLRRCQSCLALLQDRDDLLFAVSRAFHYGSPLLGLTQNPKTGPKQTRVILGRTVLERSKDNAEEGSHRRADRGGFAPGRSRGEGGGYLSESWD